MASFTSASCSPPRRWRGSTTRHVGGAVAELETGVAPEVLVREEEDLAPPLRSTRSRASRSWRPSAQLKMARAFEEVQTAPPLRPTKALRAAAEFM